MPRSYVARADQVSYLAIARRTGAKGEAMKKAFLAVSASLWLGGCFAQFIGAAKVKDGPAGCWRTCDGWGMDLVGMVKMGEYSDGCICQVRGAPPGSATPGVPRPDPSPARDRAAAEQPAMAGARVLVESAAAAAETQASSFHRWTQQTKGARLLSPLVPD
jgi:hypothetical protein